MKENQKSLALFTVREAVTGLLHKGSTPTNCVEEQDVSAHVMQELFESGPEGASQTIDYAVLYSAFHALETLGFLSRKSDSAASLRFLSWHGFQGFRTKFKSVLVPPPETEGEEVKQAPVHNRLEVFIREVIEELLKFNAISRESYKSKRQTYLE